MNHQPHNSIRHRGFSLVELLVVIAVIAMLIAIVVGAAGSLRESSLQVSEMASARSLGQAWQGYAIDNKGAVLPGYHFDGFEATDAYGTAIEPEGTEQFVYVKRWPWRLASYLGSDLHALYTDVKDYRLDQLSGEERNDLLYQVSALPSFGMNSVYVGGDENFGGFSDIFRQTFGNFYVQRLSTVKDPGKLVVFSTARGNNGVPGAEDASVVEGFFRVLPPAWSQPIWSNEYDEDDAASAGNISARHGDEVISVAVDGRVSVDSVDELRDMRRWSNAATNPDWLLTPR
jgi:prepilin-type N-terminal cleavage/methylation domain-containing protein